MSEAPERIEITAYGVLDLSDGLNGTPLAWCAGTQYIRADLVEAAVKRAIEACAEIAEETTEDKLRGHDLGQCASTDIRAIASDPEAIAKIIKGET